MSLVLDIGLISKILEEHPECTTTMFNVKERSSEEEKKKLILLDTEWACDLVAKHCARSFYDGGEFMG